MKFLFAKILRTFAVLWFIVAFALGSQARLSGENCEQIWMEV